MASVAVWPLQIYGSAMVCTAGNGLTVMVIVVLVAQSPAVGVKVYVVVAVLLIAGVQVPVMPLFEVAGRAASGSALQIAGTGVKVGVIFGFTVIVNVVVVAHNPDVGVNVYVVVVVLSNAGLQVPVMPLFDVVGKALIVAPAHIAPTGVNSGLTMGLTVMV